VFDFPRVVDLEMVVLNASQKSGISGKFEFINTLITSDVRMRENTITPNEKSTHARSRPPV